MRKTHKPIIEAFIRGEAAKQSGPATDMRGEPLTISRLHTDGQTLYSYAMPIAKRIAKGSRVSFQLVDYAQAPTATTRAHVRGCEIILAAYPCKRVDHIS